MSTSTGHTPTPWKVSKLFVREAIPYDGTLCLAVARCTNTSRAYGEAEANAAFIVQACNSHEELVEALRLCSKVLRNLPPITWADALNNSRLLELLGLNPYTVNEGLANSDTPIYLDSCGVVGKAEAALKKAGAL